MGYDIGEDYPPVVRIQRIILGLEKVRRKLSQARKKPQFRETVFWLDKKRKRKK